MQARSWSRVIPSMALLGLWATAVNSYAQTAAASVRPPVQSPGRFQLVPEPQGTMFLVDTATGRVWRYTRVTLPESDADDAKVKAYVDNMISAQEASSGKTLSEDERKAVFAKLARERKQELDTINNPCQGLVTCFVEV